MSQSEGKEADSKESFDSHRETLVRQVEGIPSVTSKTPREYAEAKEADSGPLAGFEASAAARLTCATPTGVDSIVLKFTTLSDGNEQASFVVGTSGGSIGRSPRGENVVFVPSDATLSPVRHAAIEHSGGTGGRFWLVDCAQSDHRAAVRVGVGHAAREWPLTLGAAFSAGNSVFEVVSVSVPGSEDASEAKSSPTSGGEAPPRLELLARTGPKRGSTIVVTSSGCTMGRANDNTLCIPDKELSRKHSRVGYNSSSAGVAGGGQFFVSDMGSTNGTYVQLVGPYAGKYPLHLNDHILVGRTGFSVNRWDFGVSEETGMRRTMEDKSIVVQDIVVPELELDNASHFPSAMTATTGDAKATAASSPSFPSVRQQLLAPQTWLGVYDGHGGDDASAFLQKRLHLEVSLSFARAAPSLLPAAAAAHAAMMSSMTGGAGAGNGGGGATVAWSPSPTASSSPLGGPDDPLPVQTFDRLVTEALTEAFVATDNDFLASGGQAGSTATTVLVLGSRAYCANVGDSRTVLCRTTYSSSSSSAAASSSGGSGGGGGGPLVQAVALSQDHKPSREDEAQRIKAAGGFIINKRVMGELAVSRAFGDAEFKKGISEILGEDNGGGLKRATSTAGRDSGDGVDDLDGGKQQDLSKPLVIAEPEVKCLNLLLAPQPTTGPSTVNVVDEFLILACDGLFDVMSNEEAVELAREEIFKHGFDAQKAAEAMTKRAIDDLGSRDNVSVLIVLLQDLRDKSSTRMMGSGGKR